MKLFLDTNILLDKLANRQPFVEDVKQLCVAKYFGDVELYVSVQSYLDALFVLRKYATQADLRQRCVDSFKFFEVVDVEKGNLLPALESGWPDVEDYMISKTASDMRADYLITRDVKGFENSQVPAITPKDFIKLLKDEYNVEYGVV